MRRIIFIYLILGSCYQYGFAQQTELDSLLAVTPTLSDDQEKAENLRRLHELTMFTNPELAKNYALQAFGISKKIKDERGIAAGYLQLGNYFVNRTEDDSASYYYTKALTKFEAIPSVKGQIFALHSLSDLQRVQGNYDSAIVLVNKTITLYDTPEGEQNDLGSFNLVGAQYLNLGAIYMDKGSYRLALQETLKAVRFFEEKGDKLRAADALKQMGDVEYALKEYEESLSYCKKAIVIYQEFEDKIYEAYAANAAGLAAIELDSVDMAIAYQQQAIALAREVGLKSALSSALKELGRIYIRMEDYANAKTVLTEALQIAEETEEVLVIASILLELAEVDIRTNTLNPALLKLIKVINITAPIGARDFLRTAYKKRSAVYEALNDNEAALSDFKAFYVLNDSLYNTTKSQQIEELKTIYETEEKEAALTLQQKEIETLNQQVEISNLRKGMYAGGMFAFIAISGLVFFGFSQKMKKNSIERQKQEEMYEQELAFKKKELTSQTLHLVQKNMFLENLKENLEGIQQSPDAFQAASHQIISSLKTENALDEDWEVFKSYFVEVHNDFDQKLIQIYPDITENELRLAYFLRMNLSTKEIAAMLHVLPESVRKSKYRLKKKLQLGKEEDLYGFLLTL